MNNIVAIAAALLPPALLWLYIWKRDPVKEPKGQLVQAVLYGLCICIPVSLIEVGIQQSILGGEDPETWWESTIVAFFVAALPEESVKLGGIGTLILIVFCIKMHKFAKTKVLALIEKESNGIQDATTSHA